MRRRRSLLMSASRSLASGFARVRPYFTDAFLWEHHNAAHRRSTLDRQVACTVFSSLPRLSHCRGPPLSRFLQGRGHPGVQQAAGSLPANSSAFEPPTESLRDK